MRDGDAEDRAMGQEVHHYFIFETAGGFCGIAWNSIGITRFQLPTRSADATRRLLLRRLSGAEPGAPTPAVAGAVATVKRYFAGEKTDFSGFRLDLGKQEEKPARDLIRELIEWFVADVVDELGSRREVEYAFKILEDGASADRQVEVFEQTNDLKAVVDHLVAETRAGVV